MRKLFTMVAVAAALTLVAFASPSSSAPAAGKATGSLGMAPMQYLSFDAFDYGATGDRGTVHYANYDVTDPGSGFWRLGSTFDITFLFGATPFVHTMTVDTVELTSPTSYDFLAHGFYVSDPTYTWDAMGYVEGDHVSFHLVYTGTAAGYWLHVTGDAAPNGSLSGTAGNLTQAATWSTAVDAAAEVLSYTASVDCAVIGDTSGSFGFTVPESAGLGSNLHVVAAVTDGGSPAFEHDSYGHKVAAGCDPSGVTSYAPTSGNLVVH